MEFLANNGLLIKINIIFSRELQNDFSNFTIWNDKNSFVFGTYFINNKDVHFKRKITYTDKGCYFVIFGQRFYICR